MVGVPPQVFTTFGVPATPTFAGSVSVKLMPLCAGLPALFVIVKATADVPPPSLVVAATALFSDACTTVSTWFETPFTSTPPTVTLAPPLVYAPAVLLATSTVTVHADAPAAALTPLPPTVKVPAPAAAVMVGAPPQAFTTFGVAAITTPAGSASLKVSAERAGEPAGLAIVKVSVETWPTPALAGTKTLASTGWFSTVSPELVTALVTRANALMLAAVLLYAPPATLEVTSTRTAHDGTAALIAAPVTVIVPDPAAAD